MPHRHRRHHAHARLGVILHRWHRRCGVAAALVLVWLAISGMIINGSSVLGFDQTRISWPWLMRWYGLHPALPEQGFVAATHVLVPGADNATLDGRALQPVLRDARGMVAANGLLYVSTADSLVLLKEDGTRVDELRQPPLPVAQPARIGSSASGNVVVAGDDHGPLYESSDGETWTLASAAPRWSQLQALTPAQQALAAQADRPSLPLQRVLQDAHSGRLFGRFGPTVINLTGAAACVLALSGLWMAWRAARRRRAHPA